MSAKDVAFPTALQLYYCVQKRFSLEFSRQSIQNPMSRRSRQHIHVGHLPSVSRSSCSLGPHPLALTNTTLEQLRNAASSCPDMHLLQHYPLNGWPSAKKLLPHQLQASWHFREELSIVNGILKFLLAPSSLLSQTKHAEKNHYSFCSRCNFLA